MRGIVRLRALDAKVVKGVKEKEAGRGEWEGDREWRVCIYTWLWIRQHGAL